MHKPRFYLDLRLKSWQYYCYRQWMKKKVLNYEPQTGMTKMFKNNYLMKIINAIIIITSFYKVALYFQFDLSSMKTIVRK